MCAQDAAKVHFDIDTSFFPHFQYYIWSAFSPQSAINSLQKNGSDSDSYELYSHYFLLSFLLSTKKDQKTNFLDCFHILLAKPNFGLRFSHMDIFQREGK